MLIVTNWLNILVDRGENKGYVIEAKYDLATTYLDTLVLFFIDRDFFFMARQPPVVQRLLIVEASRSHSDRLLTRDIHAPGGIRNKRAAEDPHLRPAAAGIGTVDGDASMNSSCGLKRIYPSTGLRTTCFSHR
jgi:hypothetical protein